jgi:hypothetical protein
MGILRREKMREADPDLKVAGMDSVMGDFQAVDEVVA